MSKPVFVIADRGFMRISKQSQRVEKHKGPKTLFGKIKQLYVHGSLERELGYDIVDFAAGNIEDRRTQPVIVYDYNDTPHDATLLIATSDKGNKFAFIFDHTAPTLEENKAWYHLYVNGEWLINGKER